jgi:hypothetical protein
MVWSLRLVRKSDLMVNDQSIKRAFDLIDNG